MRLLGLCCGRKMGNSEVLVKEALMGAEELGVDVEIVRLLDLKIKPCTGCTSCIRSLLKGEPGKCVIKGDDMDFLDERFLECDGMIIGAPVFIWTPPGYLKVLADRMGPSHDVFFLREVKKTKGSKNIDPRSFKRRVGAFITVGGSNPSYVSMGLPLMNWLTFPQQIIVVDQLQVTDAAEPGEVLLNEEAMRKARKLGRNVAEAMGKPITEVNFVGDEPGTCPVCHSNLLMVRKKLPVECSICGTRGTLRVDGDEITVIFNEEELKNSRWSPEERVKHLSDIREHAEVYGQRRDEIQEKLEKYRLYKSYSLPRLIDNINE